MDILSKCGKVETTILLERGIGNQALEGLCVVLFCHLYAHVFMPCFFYDLFVDATTLDMFKHAPTNVFAYYFDLFNNLF